MSGASLKVRSPFEFHRFGNMVSSDPIFNVRHKEEARRNKLVAFCSKHPRVIVGFLFSSVLVFWMWGPHGSVPVKKETREEFSVVLDAGSTGSRVHVYRFAVEDSGARVLRSDDFHQLEPGLSAYAGKPEAAAESLSPLFSAILNSVPASQLAETPCQLKATAGLRLLPGNQATDILNAVQKRLEKTPYAVSPNAVSVLDGNLEGAYGWLTLNYLLNRLDYSNGTVSAIDLGGGSVQESYEVKDVKPKENSVTVNQNSTVYVHSDGKKRPVYVHSYLSYGLMAARALILKANGSGKDNPCLAKGYKGVYSYAGEEYQAVNDNKVSPQECREATKRILHLNEPCSAPIEECTFVGVWGGPIGRNRNTTPVYLFSYFWDRAVDVGLITSAEATTWETQIDHFITHAKEVCGTSLSQLKRKFKHLHEAQLSYLCMDLTYIAVLLTDGFKLDPSQTIHLAKQINFRGQNIETSWTLGAAIDGMSAT